MNKRIALIIGLILLVILAVGVGLAQAQGTGDSEPEGSESPTETDSAISGSFPVQGRLTNSGGIPLNGVYTITFRIYDTSSDVTPLCTDPDPGISVVNGLFKSNMDNCSDYITGDSVYLGVEVNSDGEMSPRESIRPVPYAISLMPGAVISASNSGGPLLHVENRATTGRGLRAYATSTTGTNYGVVGASKSPDGYGIYGYTDNDGIAIFGWNDTPSTKPAVFGCRTSDSNTCSSHDENAAVVGYSSSGAGVYGRGADGVEGYADQQLGTGLWGQNNNSGIAIMGYGNADSTSSHIYPTLYLVQEDVTYGDFVVGADGIWGTRRWRVDSTGRGYFNGGTQVGGADFAEHLSVKDAEANYKPGDVLVISTSADKTVELSSKAFATTVIGVYSTDPGVLAGAPDTNEVLGGVPVAVVGIVPCKVSAENGPILRGDLLVTSATPGYAMKAGVNPPQGTVLGKALQPLADGLGVILILVTLQ